MMWSLCIPCFSQAEFLAVPSVGNLFNDFIIKTLQLSVWDSFERPSLISASINHTAETDLFKIVSSITLC